MPDAGCRMPDAGCRMPDATKSNLTRLDVKERLDLESGIWYLVSDIRRLGGCVGW
jgi:hypothetical protein